MLWTEEKLSKRIEELAAYRYRDRQPLDEWQMEIDAEGANGVYPPEALSGGVLRIGDRWEGRDLYVWLRRQIEVPADWQGRKAVGLFNFGKTGGGNNSGFESLLYLDGQPFQGVDSNHMEVFLPEEGYGKSRELCFRLWSGLEGGGAPVPQEHRFYQGELAWLDEAADNLYYNAKACLETANILNESLPEKQELLKAVDRAFKLLDWSRPGSESFYQSVHEADSFLNEAIDNMEKHTPVIVNCIGHTHIDVAWLWRLKHTRDKAARSFSTVLRLMEMFPDYVFLQTQPQLYAYIKQDYPEIYEQIKQRIAEGRWEPGGAMWLEADCNLPSGESLVRQILYGQQFLRREFGVTCDYLWLPDVFGYSWALPQILTKSGIKTFMTTKISWNQYNRMPHDTFKWRGIDGTEILTHFVTTPDSPNSEGWFYTYNGKVEPYSVKGIWDAYRDKGVNQELLLSYGYGDGGGGVNREHLEMRRRLDKLPGLPKVKTGRADEYFDRLHDTVEVSDQYVHTWDGELYLEYHRGTYTSQAYNKKMNRRLELLYREAEFLQSLKAVQLHSWDTYASEQLYEGWTTILRNQFHDIIPGSSIAEVYEDSRKEYAQAEALGKGAVSGAVEQLLSVQDPGPAGTYTVMNSGSGSRTETVILPAEREGDSHGAWVKSDGTVLASELQQGQWHVLLEGVPAFSGEVIRFVPGEAAASKSDVFHLAGNRLTTPFYELEWNEAGQLSEIFDIAEGRQVLEEGERGNILQVFEDKPKTFDAWDIDLFYQEKMREVDQLLSVEPVYLGQLKAVIRFTWAYLDSTIIQELTVYRDSRRIDFVTRVDWQERQQLLKAAFHVGVRATEATYDIQYGNVKRPTHWNTSWDYARFETVGHQWADLSERNYGVSLLNDCKYGYDIKDHVMRLSLLKSAIYPDPEADRGQHEFTYSLLPHKGDWLDGGTAGEAWSLNHPLQAYKGTWSDAGKRLLVLEGANIHVDAIKKAEESEAMIVRLHEYGGGRSQVRLSSDFPAASWQECNLIEEACGGKIAGQEVTFDIKPYEIKCYIVKFA